MLQCKAFAADRPLALKTKELELLALVGLATRLREGVVRTRLGVQWGRRSAAVEQFDHRVVFGQFRSLVVLRPT